MIDRVVSYLKSQGVQFRLLSFPMPERAPEVAYALPPHSQVIATQVVAAAGKPALAVLPVGEQIEYPRLSREVGVLVVEAEAADLPPPFNTAGEPIPPLGGLMGIPVFVDERVATGGALLVFKVFGIEDVLEIFYEDFARIEIPRVATFAIAGELPPPPPQPELRH